MREGEDAIVGVVDVGNIERQTPNAERRREAHGDSPAGQFSCGLPNRVNAELQTAKD